MGVNQKAPWPDFCGNDLFECDFIRHPSGQIGVIIFNDTKQFDVDKWLVDYGDGGRFSRLCLQIGDKGRACKVETNNKQETLDE